MSQDRQRNLQELLVFFLLIGIGVAGRWGQPLWCFTPTAAAAIFAGLYFERLAIAAMVPIAILAISDLLLPTYNSVPVLLATYAIMTLPICFGRLQRGGDHSKLGTILRWALFSILPATLFFIVSNFAVWAFQSDYEKSLGGLAYCYWMAVPFYRWMLTGDMFYLAVLFGAWMIAGAPSFRLQPVAVTGK